MTWEGRSGALIAGRFRVTGELGAGGMATVYRADDLDENIAVALKVIHPEFIEDPEVIARFEREIEVTNQLHHPNTLEVIAFGTTAAGERYLAMELFEGEEVDSLILDGPIAPERIARIGSQICSVLQQAHDLGILHRDLTPSNVLVAQPDDQVKVLDFGLAGLMEHRQLTDAKLTAMGIHVGTPAYMAPEYLQNLPVDNRMDLYSLGCLLYLLTTGELPFAAAGPYEVMRQHISKPAPVASALREDCPVWLDKLLASLMAKDPGERPPSARQVKRVLDASQRLDLSTATPMPPRDLPPPPDVRTVAVSEPAEPDPAKPRSPTATPAAPLRALLPRASKRTPPWVKFFWASLFFVLLVWFAWVMHS